MQKLDPTHLADWQIAAALEPHLKPIADVGRDFGLLPDEVVTMGRLVAKVEQGAVIARLPRPVAHYVDVTAITPTPLGEGKTTTTLGLVQGLGAMGLRASGAIRQPSGGPTFNIKGSAAGGGLAQCLPLAPLSLGLTGDIDCVTNANNLAMVALTARMQHERNYDDARLARASLARLDIDPARVQMRWAMDFCAQALREIVIGRGGGPRDGFEMNSGFYISVGSEVMAILAVARDLADLRARLGRIVVAFSRNGRPVTTADLEVDGAMTALMARAMNPNLMQTAEGQPMLVHAGPFANIAVGQSSIVADLVGTRLSEYHVTESGFGADIGYEKFWNIKCRYSGLRPAAVVLVASVRALKLHGGGPAVKPGLPLDAAYTGENRALVEAGCENLRAHIDIIRRSGLRPVVCLNAFHTDTAEEHATVRRAAEAAGARFAVSNHWRHGGEGARELAEAVVEAAREKSSFDFLSPLSEPLRRRIEALAREIYGADGVDFSDAALQTLTALESDPGAAALPVCMAKTQYSLSHDPARVGRPRGWRLPVREVLAFRGAGWIVPVTGSITLMPGTGSNPSFRRIDIDPATGTVTGLS
ncbi:MAG: formate--tetrahydrofolate ligase [Kiritimatiellae bacterium]|nr:formate--tetrahydrofolate ligase [Kiritimatiellia bacterium]